MAPWRLSLRSMCLMCRPDERATLDDEVCSEEVVDVARESESSVATGNYPACESQCSSSHGGELDDSARRESVDERACWICLDNSTTPENPLASACGCRNLSVHKLCLAQWQLHKAGTEEETHCRFCHKLLPDWKSHLDTEGDEQPVMCVSHQGKSHYIFPQPGEPGLQQFRERVASILSLESPSMVCLIFDCIDPFSGSRITLKGAGAYDAALHCASVAAARRRQRRALVRSANSPVKPSNVDVPAPAALPGVQ
mmetsp:Transcript_17164/g.44017  ORF Transcript_17164/g.44017 Transcript_17164/m.44017 type:complete len:255 (-) Transcript_17164:38-802(-)